MAVRSMIDRKQASSPRRGDASRLFRVALLVIAAHSIVSTVLLQMSLVGGGEFRSARHAPSPIETSARSKEDRMRRLLSNCFRSIEEGNRRFLLPPGVRPVDACRFYVQAWDDVRSTPWVDAIHMDPGRRNVVPRIIHQSWKDRNISEEYRGWSQSFRDVNPRWDYRLWTDADNRRLVEEHYPEFLSAYDAFPLPIMRPDFVRALYMHRYGGVYVDFDTVCLKPLETLFDAARGHAAYVAEMSVKNNTEPKKEMYLPGHNVPNAFLSSAKGHPFWLFFAALVATQNVTSDSEDLRPEYYGRRQGKGMLAELITGPVILNRTIETWIQMDSRRGREGTGEPGGVTANPRRYAGDGTSSLEILPGGRVYLINWQSSKGDRRAIEESCPPDRLHLTAWRESCAALYPQTSIITFWKHSWSTSVSGNKNATSPMLLKRTTARWKKRTNNLNRKGRGVPN